MKAESIVKNTLFPWYQMLLFSHLNSLWEVHYSSLLLPTRTYSSVLCSLPVLQGWYCIASPFWCINKHRNSSLLDDLWIWEPPPVLLPCLEVHCSIKQFWSHFDTALREKSVLQARRGRILPIHSQFHSYLRRAWLFICFWSKPISFRCEYAFYFRNWIVFFSQACE